MSECSTDRVSRLEHDARRAVQTLVLHCGDTSDIGEAQGRALDNMREVIYRALKSSKKSFRNTDRLHLERRVFTKVSVYSSSERHKIESNRYDQVLIARVCLHLQTILQVVPRGLPNGGRLRKR